MITLLIDGLIALVKITDRGLTALENVRRQEPPLPVDDAQPAGADDPQPVSAAGTGGHPIYRTSDLLHGAAVRLSFRGDLPQNFIAELQDRAAQFRACGD